MKRNLFIMFLIGILILVGCQNMTSGIGEKEAISIALDHASIQEDDTTMLRVDKEVSESDYTYLITFSDGKNSFEYVIGSQGDVYRSERKLANDTDKGKNDSSDSSFNEEAAFKLALEHAGVAEADAMIIKIERDYDDHDYTFEVEFRTETVSYEYEISSDGKILESEKDQYYRDDNIIYTRPTYYYTGATRYYYSGPTRYINPDAIISDQEAIAIALEHAGVKKEDASITKMERDSKEYEIDFVSGNYRYQYEVAFDGMVIKSKKKLR